MFCYYYHIEKDYEYGFIVFACDLKIRKKSNGWIEISDVYENLQNIFICCDAFQAEDASND